VSSRVPPDSAVATASVRQIDRRACAARLERDIELFGRPPFSRDHEAVTRYAFSLPFMRTLDHLRWLLNELDFDVELDPVGNFVARNCPPGTAAIALGSHCDSVRGGGRYDGILGVLCAIEVARLDRELGLGLPLQIVAWVEEEASGFGQMLLGSRVAAGELDERALREDVRSLDDGRSFWEHAEQAGLRPASLGDSPAVLDDVAAWMELHIEQGRVLEDAGRRIGVVEAIAGYVHADLEIVGRADHAGATPMGLRSDAAVVAAHCTLELERLAREAGGGLVGTVGELELDPGAINIIPGRARLSLDIRAADQSAIDAVADALVRHATEVAQARGARAICHERQRVAPVTLDEHVIACLTRATRATGAPWQPIVSGAAHDTMLVARRVPSAMLFVPCAAGVSHSPAEHASTDDAALGVEILLNAACELAERSSAREEDAR
jgi:allantoate deiminase